MGEAKTKRKRTGHKSNDASPHELAEMLRSQAGGITQDDIPPSMEVYATMEAAWENMLKQFPEDFPRKLKQDAKWIFFHGIQAAGNLMIFAAGQSKFECAADQIIKECMAYEKEAEAVLRERSFDTGEQRAN